MTNEIIRIKREEKKLSQKALSNLIGVSQQHIDRYEKGYPIPLDKVLLLSKALGIDKWDLLPKEFRDAEPPRENDKIIQELYELEVQIGDLKEKFTGLYWFLFFLFSLTVMVIFYN